MSYFIQVRTLENDTLVLQITGATEDLLKFIIDKYSSGYEIKICEETIKPGDMLQPHKQEVKKTYKRVQLDMGKVKALRKAGWSFEKIAEEFKCSTQTIINHLNKEAT